MHPRLWILCFILFLNGCTTLKQEPSSTVNSSDFSVSGAIAAKNLQHGWTGTFFWTHHNHKNYKILIYGPLGAEAVEIKQDQTGVTYREGDKILHANQAEELLAKQTGVRLPVNHLAYWIKGNVAPGPITHVVRSDDGDIMTLNQAGYTIDYQHYRNHRPYKILLNGHHLKVKMIIKQWD